MSGYNTRLAARMLDENATDTLEHDWQSAAGIDEDLRPESTEDRSLPNMSAALLEVQQRLNALEASAASASSATVPSAAPKPGPPSGLSSRDGLQLVSLADQQLLAKLRNLPKLDTVRQTSANNVLTWLQNIQYSFAVYGIPRANWVVHTLDLLDSPVRNHFIAKYTPDSFRHMDWAAFSEEIREKFLPPHLLSTLIHQLDNLHQDRQESLASYAARTLTLLEQLQLLPDGKLFATSALVSKRFINGIRSNMTVLLLNQWVTLQRSEEVDFRQLREYALKIDNQTRTKDHSTGADHHRQLYSVQVGNRSSTSHDRKSRSSGKDSAFKEHRAARQESRSAGDSSAPRPSNSTIRCYNCGKLGHRSSDCRRTRRSQSPEREQSSDSSSSPMLGAVQTTDDRGKAAPSVAANKIAARSKTPKRRPQVHFAEDLEDEVPLDSDTLEVNLNPIALHSLGSQEHGTPSGSLLYLPIVPLTSPVPAAPSEILALLDSGAEISVISRQVARQLQLTTQRIPATLTAQFAHGDAKVVLRETCILPFRIAGTNVRTQETFFILDSPASLPAILSQPFIAKMKMNIDFHSKLVTIPSQDGTAGRQRLPLAFHLPAPGSEAHRQAQCLIFPWHADWHSLQPPPPEDMMPWVMATVSSPVPPSSLVAQVASSDSPLAAQALQELLDDFSDVLVDELPIQPPVSRGQYDVILRVPDDVRPIRRRPYRLPATLQEELAKTIDFLLARGIIEQNNDVMWQSPVIFVRKGISSEGIPQFRFCIDYRGVNNHLLDDSFPPPVPTELMERIGRVLSQRTESPSTDTLYFSKLDMASGFWQLALTPASSQYTGFVTEQGAYQFRALPFGLKNATAAFQKFSQGILAGMANVLVYVDDILLFSLGTPLSHLQQVRLLLERLRHHQVFVKRSKCVFLQTQINFLGYTLNAHGIAPEASKVAAIEDFPPPASVKQLRQFLGLANFYRRFIKNFANYAAPLSDLLKTGQRRFVWTRSAETAFAALKTALTQAPVLAHFRSDRPTILYTDASDLAIGAALHQIDENNEEHPVAFYGKKLSSAERNYSTYDRELLALKESLRHFSYYLIGRRFRVCTDHHSLVRLNTQSELSPRLARWLSIFLQYDMEIHHIPGETNVVADALSRISGDSPASSFAPQSPADLTQAHERAMRAEDIARDLLVGLHTVQMLTDSSFVSQLMQNYTTCPDFQVLYQLGKDGELLGQPGYRHFDFSDDLLYHVDSTGRTRICVPTALRAAVLRLAHDDAGHVGSDKTYLSLVAKVYWNNMKRDVENYVHSCLICQAAKNYKQKPIGLPKSHDVPADKFDVISVDLLSGLPPTSQGHDSLFVMLDSFSQHVTLAPTHKSATTQELVDLFLHYFYRTRGLPAAIISDNGPNVSSHFWDTVFQTLGVQVRHSSKYYPQANGRVERINATILDMLRTKLAQGSSEWTVHLPFIEFALNHAPRRETGLSAFQVEYGKNPRSVMDLALDQVLPQAQTTVDNIRAGENLVRDTLASIANRAETRLLPSRRPLRWQVGDLVWIDARLFNQQFEIRKFRDRYIGPFPVTEVFNNNNYRVDVRQRFPRMDQDVFNAKFLRPHVSRKDHLQQPVVSQPVPGFYEVARIINHRERHGAKQYLVRWKGFSSADDTWEPVAHLSRTPALRQLLQNYEQRRTRQDAPAASRGQRRRRAPLN